jgi:hypothetical protein
MTTRWQAFGIEPRAQNIGRLWRVLWTSLLRPPGAVSLVSPGLVDARWFDRGDRVGVRYRVRDELLRESQTVHSHVVREPLRPEIRAVRELAVPVLLTAEAAVGAAAMNPISRARNEITDNHAAFFVAPQRINEVFGVWPRGLFVAPPISMDHRPDATVARGRDELPVGVPG